MTQFNPVYQPCFVCLAPVELTPNPRFPSIMKQLDENNHALCAVHQPMQYEIERTVETWPSSEDRDLLVCNAGTEGMRRGREELAEPARALIAAFLATGMNECPYCDIGLPYDAGANVDPDNHKSTCVWARLVRALRSMPLDGGVQP